MKRKFSKSWNSSSQPRKQRKFSANAPLHIKRKLMSVNLSKELRKKYGKRNVVVRKGDSVKIMRGSYKGKSGKVLEVKTKMGGIYVEGIQIKKRDGSKANVKLRPSNLQIIELNMDDKKRNIQKESKKEVSKKKEKKETTKKADKKEKVKEKKK